MKTSESHTSVHFLSIDSERAGQRIDNFLITHLKGLPKSRIYRILRKGEVRVNKKRVSPDYRLQAGDNIRIPPMRLGSDQPQVAKPSRQAQERLEQRILYEDSNLLIINKPAGVAVHGGSGVSFGVIETLRHLRPQAKFLELVHRLDRDTSGCLLIAKKSSILKDLHTLLRSGQVEKVYLALVQGYWPKNMSVVEAPLQKHQLQSGERMVKVHAEGKAACTEFRVVRRFANATLVEARPKTGRTHQIRVHALHAGHPIVADDKYGDRDFNKAMNAYGCKRLFLHAYALNFVLSTIGQKIEVKAELDPDLAVCLQALELEPSQ